MEPEFPKDLKKRDVLAVDPGISGTGVAWWRANALVPSETFVFNAPKKYAWWIRAALLAEMVMDVVDRYKIPVVVCECPQFFGGAGGEMVAARGDLVKLSIAVGAMVGQAQKMVHAVDFWPVEVNTWKGQLKKEIVNKRILRTLGASFCDGLHSHDWDAVGIGLWARGDFK